MAIEIKEMSINTSIDGKLDGSGDKDISEELLLIRNSIIKECMEKFKEYLERKNDK